MLTQYQRGSIAGAVLVGVALVFAFNPVSHPEGEAGAEKAEQPRRDHQEPIPVWYATAHDPVALFTFGLLIVAGCQAWLFLRQLHFMRGGLADARKAAEAADKSARAAGSSVVLAQDTARKQLRAYVHVAGIQVEYDSATSTGSVTAVFKNYGQTRALKAYILIGVTVREWPLRSRLRSVPASVPRASEPLPPGREAFHIVPISPLNAYEIGELKAGRAGVYAWGKVIYVDIYGDPQNTDFRYVCEGEGLRIGRMHACESGNDAT